MNRRISTSLGLVAVVVAGVVALVGAQGKAGAGPKVGTATFDCTATDSSRGLCATQALTAELSGSGLNEMEIRDASASMILGFNGQRPFTWGPVDCPSLGPCLWSFARDPRSLDFQGFAIGTNILNAAGAELSGGLLGMAVGPGYGYKVRFNMTITVPETAPGFWKFNFNSTNPATGGGDDADVERVGTCTWVFDALSGQRASLSILVKPPRGKQSLQREGTYQMPFVLTFDVPNCGG